MFTIQQSRWDKLIRRVTGSIGPGSRVGTSISDLFPVIDVESVPSELLALAGTRLSWGRALSAAVVGEFARCQLFNPADSGKLITITSLWLSRDTGSGSVELGLLSVALANKSAVAQFRDTRLGITPNAPTGELRTDSNVASTPDLFRISLTTNLTFLGHDPNDICVLAPGTGLVSTLNTQNQPFVTGYMWRERAAEQSELNF